MAFDSAGPACQLQDSVIIQHEAVLLLLGSVAIGNRVLLIARVHDFFGLFPAVLLDDRHTALIGEEGFVYAIFVWIDRALERPPP